MAKTSDTEPYRIAASQLFESKNVPKAIPLCLSADIALGGGIPLGGTILIGSPPKSGKTTVAVQWGANAQNLYNSKIFYYNLEFRLTKLVLSQVQGLKLDQDHFEIIQPPPITNGTDIVGYKKFSAEQWLEHIGQTLTENQKAVIIVDSVAVLSSEKEQSEGIGYSDRGKKNQLDAQFCRKYAGVVQPNSNTLVLITQIMANPSGYGAPIGIKASNSFKHQADVYLSGKSLSKWPEEGGKILGHDVAWQIQASAFGPPFMEMVVPIRYGYGVDTIKDLITHCVNWEIIKRGGAWYTLPFVEEDGKLVFKDTAEKPLKVQGETGVRNWLMMHPTEMALLDKMIREKIFA